MSTGSVSACVQGMPRSGIRVLLDLAARVPGAIHLEIGQPDFATPGFIIEAAHEAMVAGFTRYTANAGLPSLREAVAAKVKCENGIPATADNVVITTGGMGGLYSSFAALLDPGDEVLLPDPGYPNYEQMALLRHATPVRYPLPAELGFQPDLAALERAITPRSKALVVNSPSNPTGAVLTVESIGALVLLAEKHGLYLISDECYEKIVFDAQHASPAALCRDGRVITVSSFSKTYAMTGWRVGFAVATPAMVLALAKLQEPTVGCASSVSQKAAEAALAGPQECVSAMVAAYRQRRDQALDVLQKHGLYSYTPQGAFYLLVPLGRSHTDSAAFAKEFLMAEGVAVAPGCTFGPRADGYVRVSLAAAESELLCGLERLCRYIRRQA
jgi:aspartate/methionine/tyrosine aminotransferase